MTLEKELPEGWALEGLGALCSKIGSGSTPRGGQNAYVSVGVPLIRSMNIHFDLFKEDGLAFINDEAASKLNGVEVFRDDVLLNITGASIGRVNIVPEKYIGARVNQHVAIVRAFTGVKSRYIWYFLRTPALQNIIKETESGATRQALTKDKISSFKIPLPPLAEQQVIADTLDALLAQVETTKTRLERVPETIKRFRQSVLAAAVSGKLTEEWRAEEILRESGTELLLAIELNRESSWRLKGKYKKAVSVSDRPVFAELPTQWKISSLDQLVDSNRPICYGILMPKENLNIGVLYVKVRDINNNKIELNGLQRTSFEIASKYQRSSLWAGDLLVTIRGTYGKTVEVPPELEGGNITQDTARISVHKFMDHRYVLLVLKCEQIQHFFKDVARGVAVKGVNIGDLRTTPVPIPPLPEQQEIVRRVEELFAHADAVEQQAKAALEKVNNLTQSILAKAFRGELTADWRAANPELISGENSAEALLARIREERAAQKPVKQSRTRKKT